MAEYGICDLSTVPVRAEASDKSEMVSQLLFGETFTILLKKSPWVRIKASFDGYEGWVDEKQYTTLSAKDFKHETEHPAAVAFELMQPAISPAHYIPVLAGSSLPRFDGMNFRIGNEKFVYNGQAIDNTTNGNDPARLVEKCALKFLNAPYLWGGRSPFGIDCSGFTQVVFKLLGIPLLRDAYQQAQQGTNVPFVSKANEGDLAFFSKNDKEEKITHVGIILKDNRIIHASGRVRIDAVDSYGIHDEERGKHTHKLRIVKRLF